MTTKAEIEKDGTFDFKEEEELDLGQFPKLKRRRKKVRPKKVETVEEFLARGGKIRTVVCQEDDIPKGLFNSFVMS